MRVLALALVALAWGCSIAPPESGPAEVVVQNDRPTEARIVVGNGLGDYRAFSIPANSWARLPGTWATEYQIDDQCVVVSASNFYPGGLAIVHIDREPSTYDVYHPSFMPTIGPLSSAAPLSICPNGPTFVP